MIVASKRFPLVHVFQSREFSLLWAGQTISAVGDYIFRVALAWEVYVLTHSAFSASLTFIASLLPNIVFMVVGGVAADRVSKRLIFFVSDFGRALVVGLVAVLSLLHLLQFWHFLVLSFIFGVVDSFFMPAAQAIKPQLVEKSQLQAANSLTQISTQLSMIVGPTIGAFILTIAGPATAFGLDGISFLISACCILALRLSSDTEHAGKDSLSNEDAHPPQSTLETHTERASVMKHVLETFHSAKEGFAYITGSIWLWSGIVLAAIINVTFFAPIAVSFPKLVHDFYHANAWMLGELLTAYAVGGLLGNVLAGSANVGKRSLLLAYLSLLVSCAGLILLGSPVGPHYMPIVPLVAGALAGFGFGYFMIVWETVIQQHVPETVLGRVISVDMLGSYVLIPLGLGAVGVLTDRFGPAVVFVVGGVLSLMLVLLALSVRDIRRIQ